MVYEFAHLPTCLIHLYTQYFQQVWLHESLSVYKWIIEHISDRVKGILEEERVREDFVREVTCIYKMSKFWRSNVQHGNYS